MSSRAKRKKEFRAKNKAVKKPKQRLGSIHDCCGNCMSGLDIFSKHSAKCNNKVSPYFKFVMPNEDYCTEYK